MSGYGAMSAGRLARVLGCVLLAGQGVVQAADSGKKDAVQRAGLVRSGDVYVLPAEKDVLEGMKSLQQEKRQADSEARTRKAIITQEATKRKLIESNDREWHTLESKLSLVTDVGVHNRIVLRMNRLVADIKEAQQAQKDLEEKSSKLGTEGQNKFVDDLAALTTKSDSLMEKYKSLSEDAEVKAAIAGSSAKVALGPSPQFSDAAAELKKWQSAVESEAIPLREQSGIHVVDVLLNGEHFLMGLDTGASSISLSAEAADKLNMKPGENDPTVQLQLADGNIIEGKQMSIKTVRVGRFTVNDVTCVVLEKGLAKAPLILGGSFLNHFVFKVDPAKGELQLTQVVEENPLKPARQGPAAGAAEKN
jgi:clan AA aspartic protease (TIGR02281 family)